MWRSSISRRSALAAGIGLAVLTAAHPSRATTPGLTDAQHRATRFLDLMMDAHQSTGPRLLQSHADEVGLYTTGFTYDSALAVLAYLADGRPDSIARAGLIGDALCYVEAHDPAYHDGRLRQAYHTGPYSRGGVQQPYGLIRPDGTANIGGAFGFTASGTGSQAWAGIALCALYRRTADPAHLATARRLADWLIAACRSTGRQGGFTIGADRAGDPQRAVSTSYNAVIVAFLGQLYTLTGELTYMDNQQAAVQLVNRMWNADRQCYLRGSATGDDAQIDILTLEAQTLVGLAMPSRRTAAALAVAARDLSVTDDATRPNSALAPGTTFTGPTFSAASRTASSDAPIEGDLPKPDPNAVWLEGTAQLAAALGHSPTPSAADAPLAMVARAQAELGARQHVGDRPIPQGLGVVAATSPLHVGVEASGYYPYLHVASTAWFVLAATGVNPLYSDYS